MLSTSTPVGTGFKIPKTTRKLAVVPSTIRAVLGILTPVIGPQKCTTSIRGAVYAALVCTQLYSSTKFSNIFSSSHENQCKIWFTEQQSSLFDNYVLHPKNHPKNVLRMLFISPHYRATRSGKSAEKSVPEPARRAVSAREIHPLRPNRPEGLRASGRRTVELEELRRRGEEAVAGAACADEGALSFNTTMCHSYRDSPYKR